MRRKLILSILLAVILIPGGSFAQRLRNNIPNFEHRKFYFGTHLGVNTTTFKPIMKTNLTDYDSIYNIDVRPGPGLAIHLPLIAWAPTDILNVRFMPSISFHEIEFNYQYYQRGVHKTKSFPYDATNLNFPLFLKLNSRRINNFSAYGISGFSYSYNLQNDEDVSQKSGDPILKINKNDFAYHVGGGFDFYMPYFKFGLEIRLSNGIKNVLIQDNTFFSNPLAGLKSQVWWFSVTFEG